MQESKLQSYIKSLIYDASAKRMNISTYTDVNVLSDAVFDRYIECVHYFQDVCIKNNSICGLGSERKSMIKLMTDFANKCKSNDCKIAIAGKVKVGKSSFINALLGGNVVSIHPTPETSVLTKFRYSKEGNYVKVSYYKVQEWNLLWESVMSAHQNSIRNDHEDFLSEYDRLRADELQMQLLNKSDDIFTANNDAELRDLIDKYTSCQNPHHFFAKEVEVGLSTFSIPKNIVLINTPGIDDPVSYRTDITHQHLCSADIVLLCVKAVKAKLHADDLENIAVLFSKINSQDKINIIGTFYDLPSNFSKCWEENTKPEFIKSFSTKVYFGSEMQVVNRILPASALYYNTIQHAKDEPDFWECESNVDYLAEALCRCLGSSRAYQYGKDSKALKRCLYENLLEVEAKTNIPNIVCYIISEAEKYILADIKDTYINICNHLSKITPKAISSNSFAIIGQRSASLKSQTVALDSKIRERRKYRESSIRSINEILQSLRCNNEGLVNNG